MFPIDSLHGACHIKRGSGGWAEDLRTRGHMHKPSMRKVEQISALSTLDDTCIKISLEYYALHLCVALRCQGCLRACLFALILTAGSTICLLGVFTSAILMLFSGAAWGNISIASLYEQKNSHKNDIYMDKCEPKIVACEQKTDAKHVRQLVYMWRTFGWWPAFAKICVTSNPHRRWRKQTGPRTLHILTPLVLDPSSVPESGRNEKRFPRTMAGTPRIQGAP